MGNPLVRFWEGQEDDWYMEEILWHRRESRRQTEKTNFFLRSGSLLSTHKVCLNIRALRLLDQEVTWFWQSLFVPEKGCEYQGTHSLSHSSYKCFR